MRPNQDEYFLDMAKLVSSRSTCLTRKVGCVFVSKKNIVLATGYNGIPRGMPHCTKEECPRFNKQSGESLATCFASHSEMNALIYCHDNEKIEKAYITASPCLTCTVMLLNTSCKEIIYEEYYPTTNDAAQRIWKASGRIWKQM